jgi:hypothetical protein
MFLCHDCHQKTACSFEHNALFTSSQGRCEGCSFEASCIDCHHHHVVNEQEPAALNNEDS